MSDSRTVKIVIAFQKSYRMPSDEMYIPLLVGAELVKDSFPDEEVGFYYEKDNTGDHISALNQSFCELTGLYWAWKNIKADYKGLVQYRRFFRGKAQKDPFLSILKFEDIKGDLNRVKVFVPEKRYYFIETLYSHYAHTHYAEHLDMARNIITEKYPEYESCCQQVYQQRSGYMFNMMIMRQDLLDEYCPWLFDILFELKKRIQTTDLSEYQGRLYGRVSEILFNVWLQYQMKTGKIKKKEVQELPLVFIGKENWRKKILAFLKAKYLGIKYSSNFWQE